MNTASYMRNLFCRIVLCFFFILGLLYPGSVAAQPNVVTEPSDATADCDENTQGALNLWFDSRGGFLATGVAAFGSTLSEDQVFNQLDSLRANACNNALLVINVGFWAVNAVGTSTDTFLVSFTFPDVADPIVTQQPTSARVACALGIQDSLTSWIQDAAGALATDACRGDVTWNGFTWTSGSRSGNGSISDGPFDIIDNSVCDQTFDFTFVGVDVCNGTISTSSSFELFTDSAAIQVDAFPTDLQLDCDNVINSSILTWYNDNAGFRATSLISTITISADLTLDSVLAQVANNLSSGCKDFTIPLEWTATDGLGTTSDAFTASLIVSDNQAPQLTAVATDLSLPCNIDVVPQLTTWIDSHGGASAQDNCSDPVIWTRFTWTSNGTSGSGIFNSGPYNTIVDAGGCVQTYAFRFEVEDDCGNLSVATANLNLVDTAIVIVSPATDLSFSCDLLPDPIPLLTNWYNARAGFQASAAGISLPSFASKTLADVLTEFIASFMDNCNEGMVSVDFFGADSQGNRSDVSTATFSSLDDTPPVINTTPSGITFECGALDQNALQNWIQSFGGAQANDVCSDSIFWTMFSWQSSSGTSGSGNFETGPFAILDATDCFENAQVTFFVSDPCGNLNSVTALFSIQDTTPLVDTIPPVITAFPTDVNTDCSEDILSSLQSWYNSSGGLMATDENNVVNLRATKSFEITQQDFNASDVMSNCANGSVTVGFFALDTLGNSSDTAFATFSAVDTIPPDISTPPIDLNMPCNVGASNSLRDWIQRFGDAQATDDCSDEDVIWAQFSWTDSEGNSGTGTFTNGPFNFVPNALCSWSVDVTFLVQDACGNQQTTQATFSLFDNEAPVFQLVLPDTAFNCDNVPSASTLIAMDACEGQIMATVSDNSTQSNNSNTCEFFNYQLLRTYTATDRCGNSTSFTQVITVSDTLEPRFQSPPDISISCLDNSDPDITGRPINIIDNCASEVIISFTDSELGAGCDMQIVRTWEIRDICGSSLILPQTITIRDSVPPRIVAQALDVEIMCSADANFDEAFMIWVNDMGGAQAEEECGSLNQSFAAVPGSYDVNDPTTFPGTSPASLDLTTCPSAEPGTARFERVDFVFVDDCNNAAVTSGSFKIIDDEGPIIDGVPSDMSFTITEGVCTIDVVIPAINIEDACSGVDNVISTVDRYNIASGELGNEQVPVDSFRARFGPFDGALLSIQGDITLEVFMINIDADDPTEFFNIVAEDGTDLGRTPNTFAQCGDTSFVINITREQFLNWIADEFIEIDFIPNTPAGLSGALAINDVCFGAGTRMIFELDIDIDVSGMVDYKIQIDDNAPVVFDAVSDYTASIGSGSHTITYLVSDCAGNLTTASYAIEISEIGTPQVSCPENITAILPFGNCSMDLTLPLNFTASDDCALADSFQYFVTGVTEINPTSFLSTEAPIAHLNIGVNEINYIISDISGNTASCSFTATIEDAQDPAIQCFQNSVVHVHPSGILPLIIESDDVLDSATDNCEIAAIQFQNTDFSCNDIGSVVPITVIVSDASGNSSTCITNARIAEYTVEPIAQSLLCAGDTLKLQANVPPTEGSDVYVFNWTGPNNFTSSDENPVVTNASTAFSGVYNVEVLGANGCRSTGSVEVFIEDFNTPQLAVNLNVICEGQEVVFTTTEYQSSATYTWFKGIPPTGEQIGLTQLPTFAFTPLQGVETYYVIAENQACETTPSAIVTVTVNAVPQVTVNDSLIVVCERSSFQLGTSFVGGINTNYRWIGPNGFSSDAANPPIFQNVTVAQAGNYALVIEENGCESRADITTVQVQAFPSRPSIVTESMVCEGEDLILLLVDSIDNEGTLHWLLNGKLFASVNGNGLIVPNIADSLEGLWQVYLEIGSCISDTSNGVLVTIEDALNLNIANDTVQCETDDIILMTNTIPGATYEWTGPGNFRSFEESPAVIITAGTYSVSVTTGTGCVNTTSIDITTVDRPRIIEVENRLEECADGFGSIFIIPDVGPDSNYTFKWEGPNGFVSTEEVLVFNEFNADISGDYFLTVSSDICDSETEIITLALTDVPRPPDLGQVVQACVGEFVTLTINNPEEGIDRFEWTTPMGVFETTVPTFEIPSIALANAGIYLATAERNGCISGQSAPLNVNVFTIPNAPGVMSNAPVCEGEDLILQATQILNAEYEWLGPNGFMASGDRVVIRNTDPSHEGDYSVRIILNSCPSEFSVLQDIELLPKPQTPITELTEFDICADDMPTTMLCIDPGTFDPQSEYIWTNLTTENILGRTSERCLAIDDVNLFVVGENRIAVEELSDGCISDPSNAISFVVSERLDFTADAGDDIVACDIANVQLNASNPAQGTGRWSALDPQISFSDDTDPNAFVFDIRDGENILVWQLENGACTGDMDMLIVATEIDAVANDDLLETPYNGVLRFDPTENDDLPDEFNFEVLTEPEVGGFFINDLGEYVYNPLEGFIGSVSLVYKICSAFCDDNCDEATITITVGDVTDCFAPSLITPNGDGINDLFVIPCIESGLYPNNQLFIYNQYGDQLLDAVSYDNDWGGTYEGEDLPTGTYYYVFRANNTLAPEKGFIIIER